MKDDKLVPNVHTFNNALSLLYLTEDNQRNLRTTPMKTILNKVIPEIRLFFSYKLVTF